MHSNSIYAINNCSCFTIHLVYKQTKNGEANIEIIAQPTRFHFRLLSINFNVIINFVRQIKFSKKKIVHIYRPKHTHATHASILC